MSRFQPRLYPVVFLTVVAMVLVVAIIVGWSIIFPLYHAAAFTAGWERGGGLWVVMGLGHAFLSLVLVVLAWFLAALIRQHRLLRQQDTFIDTVTHELRTPLAGLRLAVETLNRHRMDDQERAIFLQRMHTDLERLQALIEHLIDANCLAHGQRAANAETIDVSALCVVCRDRITARHLLEGDWCRCPDTTIMVMTDRSALETILLNLLDNAVRYSSGQPQVAIRTTLTQNRLNLQVSDRGRGFAPHQQQRIFHRFVRLPSAEPPPPGTGLGLFIVAALCQRLGGSAAAHSDGPGQGASFLVTLPVTAAAGCPHD